MNHKVSNAREKAPACGKLCIKLFMYIMYLSVGFVQISTLLFFCANFVEGFQVDQISCVSD